LKVPQIGWNQVSITRSHPLLEDVASGSYFYFVHSYYADPLDPAIAVGLSDYGVEFAAIVASDNVVATQFHPEKSADLGLRLYANFGQIAVDHQLSAISRR
jgi:glutamine amidotransferase